LIKCTTVVSSATPVFNSNLQKPLAASVSTVCLGECCLQVGGGDVQSGLLLLLLLLRLHQT